MKWPRLDVTSNVAQIIRLLVLLSLSSGIFSSPSSNPSEALQQNNPEFSWKNDLLPRTWKEIWSVCLIWLQETQTCSPDVHTPDVHTPATLTCTRLSPWRAHAWRAHAWRAHAWRAHASHPLSGVLVAEDNLFTATSDFKYFFYFFINLK